jgi:hypothetical protein
LGYDAESMTGSDCQKQDWPTHKKNCRAENYILDVKLVPDRIVDPPVTRTLSCPAGATFMDLHKALQVAFRWASTHTFDFKIKDPNARPPLEFNLMDHIAKMQAKDRADLAAASSGQALPEEDKGPRQNSLRIVQWSVPPKGLKGGIDMMHNHSRVHPQTPEVSASKVKLGKILEQYKGAPIEYEYDFGDSWEHSITVIGRAPATEVFVCTGGEGHGVAEDVGSDKGWKSLKEAYRAQKPSKDQKDSMRWFETQASNADPHGLGNGRDRFFDRDGVNFKLARI